MFLLATIEGSFTFAFLSNGLYEFKYVFIVDSPHCVSRLHHLAISSSLTSRG